ncbi:radical SAM protein [bacterium]|nr:radical SAM protein [bacterium]
MCPGRRRLERFWDGQRLKFVWNKLEVLSLDGRSRPVALTMNGRQYRRGLDGNCKEIVRVAGPTERDLYDAVPMAASQMDDLLREWSQRISSWMPFEVEDWLVGLRRDARNFCSIYQPVSILPPDQYRSLVFQLTEGCAYNRCSFCQLYQDRPYRCKDRQSFSRHIGRVLEYFGPALPWRRGVFLGDANAAGISTARLSEALEQIRQSLPCDGTDQQGAPRHPLQFEQVSSFQDTFSGRLRAVQDWRQLRKLGLDQVHLGIESGSSAVLDLLRKPIESGRVVEMINRLQQADIRVSLIFLLGAGGRELAHSHVHGTLELLQRVQLRAQDRVYLSDLLVHPGSDYHVLSQELGITPLTRWECREQARTLRESLRYEPPPRGPAVALYDVRQFVYV